MTPPDVIHCFGVDQWLCSVWLLLKLRYPASFACALQLLAAWALDVAGGLELGADAQRVLARGGAGLPANQSARRLRQRTPLARRALQGARHRAWAHDHRGASLAGPPPMADGCCMCVGMFDQPLALRLAFGRACLGQLASLQVENPAVDAVYTVSSARLFINRSMVKVFSGGASACDA